MITYIFEAIGFLAIAAGGFLAAFSARNPSRMVLWASSYLVLIVGLAQIGLGYSLARLQLHSLTTVYVAMTLFNFGNALVLLGTIRNYHKLAKNEMVKIGSTCLCIAMLLLLSIQNYTRFSWPLVWFVALALVIVASAYLGTMMAIRRKARQNS